MVTTVTRSLEDGADYAPDWRHQVVLEYLKAHAASGGKRTWEELLDGEPDVVARQVVRYHLNSSLIPEAVRYALVAQQSNASTGMATLIRAMIIGDRRFGEIADEVGTKPINIAIFVLLFWDIRRYLSREYWLEGLTRQQFCQGGGAERVRERRLLRIAFERGWEGLQEELSPRKNRSAEDVKLLMEQVQHAVCARAFEFVQDLQDGGTPATEADFVRCMQVMAVKSREVLPETDSTGWSDWLKEAIDRKVIPAHVVEMAKMGDGEGDARSDGRRRRRALAVDASPLDRMEAQGVAEARVENQSEIPAQETPLEQDKVEVPAG